MEQGIRHMTLSANTGSTHQQIMTPRSGYDLIAPYYEQWRWFHVWRLNEAPLIQQWLRSVSPGFGLDAGSGTGPYLADISACGHRCVAMDLSWQMLRRNKQKCDRHACPLPVFHVQGTIDHLPFTERQFDWVLCTRVLSHIQDITGVLAEFARVLSSGSECLVSDIHPQHPYTHMAIATDRGKITLETHKHSLDTLQRAVADVDKFRIVSMHEYALADLIAPPSQADFQKLYSHSNTAMFYLCKLQKQ
jgi:ubiquinone/menaquinone biosynthesis C-methylase UbiE